MIYFLHTCHALDRWLWFWGRKKERKNGDGEKFLKNVLSFFAASSKLQKWWCCQPWQQCAMHCHVRMNHHHVYMCTRRDKPSHFSHHLLAKKSSRSSAFLLLQISLLWNRGIVISFLGAEEPLFPQVQQEMASLILPPDFWCAAVYYFKKSPLSFGTDPKRIIFRFLEKPLASHVAIYLSKNGMLRAPLPLAHFLQGLLVSLKRLEKATALVLC